MSELPNGWTATKLKETTLTRKGKKPQQLKVTADTGLVPYLDIRAIETNEIRQFADVRSSRIATKNDVLMVWDGARSGWVGIGKEGAIGSTIMALESLCGDPRYLYYFLQSSFDELNSNTRGTGIPHVDPDIYNGLLVPVAPLNEQRRIVAKLEVLLGKVDVCQQRLAKFPRLLKRFRQSIFDLAISGKLTEDWRTQHQHKHSAKTDFQLFLTQKKSRSKDSEPNEGCELLVDTIPNSWEAPQLEDLFRFIDYRGKNPEKTQRGKRLITAKNIRMGYLSDSPAEFISDETYAQWMTRGFPKKGDILFVTEGATMGFVAINNRDDEFALAQRTLTLQPYYPVNTKIFLYFMMSSLFQNLVKLNATGSAAVGIKAARFKGFPIAFPSLAEQQEIVRRVEAFFRLADQLEARYHKAKAHVDKLTQSLLAKAFRGELVPQDPQDEPAAVLLERIRAERAAAQSKPSAKTAKRTAKARK